MKHLNEVDHPVITLYSKQQITDVKCFCGTGRTFLGVDKTYNLGDVHVTPTVFKDFSVKRKDSGNIQLLSDQLSFTQTLVLGHTARFSTTLPIIYLKKRLET